MFGVGEPVESFIVQAAAGNIVLSDPLLAMNSIAPTDVPMGPPCHLDSTPSANARNSFPEQVKTTATFRSANNANLFFPFLFLRKEISIAGRFYVDNPRI